MIKKIMFLGAGAFSKEFVLAAQKLGQHTIAVDDYDEAPAMQVSDERAVINLQSESDLDRVVAKFEPDVIIPTSTAIATSSLLKYELEDNIDVITSAKAVHHLLDRTQIFEIANQLDIKVAPHHKCSINQINSTLDFPVIVEPAHYKSAFKSFIARSAEAINKGLNHQNAETNECILFPYNEDVQNFTLLAVSQQNNSIQFCPLIGHNMESQGFQESWQPFKLNNELIEVAQTAATKLIQHLTGVGLWGFEFTLINDQLCFNGINPTPFDTGLVSLGATLNINEFEMHLKAALNLPINTIGIERSGVNARLIQNTEDDITYVQRAPIKGYRKTGITTIYGNAYADMNKMRQRARRMAEALA